MNIAIGIYKEGLKCNEEIDLTYNNNYMLPNKDTCAKIVKSRFSFNAVISLDKLINDNKKAFPDVELLVVNGANNRCERIVDYLKNASESRMKDFVNTLRNFSGEQQIVNIILDYNLFPDDLFTEDIKVELTDWIFDGRLYKLLDKHFCEDKERICNRIFNKVKCEYFIYHPISMRNNLAEILNHIYSNRNSIIRDYLIDACKEVLEKCEMHDKTIIEYNKTGTKLRNILFIKLFCELYINETDRQLCNTLLFMVSKYCYVSKFPELAKGKMEKIDYNKYALDMVRVLTNHVDVSHKNFLIDLNNYNKTYNLGISIDSIIKQMIPKRKDENISDTIKIYLSKQPYQRKYRKLYHYFFNMDMELFDNSTSLGKSLYYNAAISNYNSSARSLKNFIHFYLGSLTGITKEDFEHDLPVFVRVLKEIMDGDLKVFYSLLIGDSSIEYSIPAEVEDKILHELFFTILPNENKLRIKAICRKILKTTRYNTFSIDAYDKVLKINSGTPTKIKQALLEIKMKK